MRFRSFFGFRRSLFGSAAAAERTERTALAGTARRQGAGVRRRPRERPRPVLLHARRPVPVPDPDARFRPDRLRHRLRRFVVLTSSS